jgi:hypothetical protein
LVYTVDYDTNVCRGEEVEVTIKNLWGQKYAISFESGPYFTDTIFRFDPATTKAYLIEVIDSNSLGCPADKVSINIKVDLPSEVNLRSQKVSDVFCTGDTVKLVANSGKDNYYFYVNKQLRLSTKDSFYYANNFNNGDSVWVIYEHGACRDTSEKKHISIVPLPDATFTWERDTTDKTKVILKFKAVNQFLPSYKFDFGDGSTSVLKNTSNDYTSKIGQSIVVSLTVNDNSDCVNSTSQTILVPTLSVPGALDVSANVMMYPNPSSTALYIEFKDAILAENISISDLEGRVLVDHKTENNLTIMDVSGFSNGLYVVKLTYTDGQSYFYRMAKK